MLTRQNTLWAGMALTFTAILGLTGCSGGTTPATPTAPATSESAATDSAPAETPAAGESMQACLDLAGPFAEAGAKIAAIASGSENPQAVVDSYTALVDALGAIADSAAGDDMQAAASAAQSDMAAVRDGLQKVYVDGDMLALGELTTATTAMQKSYSALLEHCSA